MILDQELRRQIFRKLGAHRDSRASGLPSKIKEQQKEA